MVGNSLRENFEDIDSQCFIDQEQTSEVKYPFLLTYLSIVNEAFGFQC